MTANGKTLVAALTDTEALSGLKPAVTLYGAPDCPIKGVPEQFVQPSETQQAFDGLRTSVEVAHPNDGKQVLEERKSLRKTFNEVIGGLVDVVELASRKQPELLAKFGVDFLFRPKPASANKTTQYRIPSVILHVDDKQPKTIYGKVPSAGRSGVEIFHAYDDPTVEANWMHYDSYVGGTFTMTGMPSGKRTYVRARFLMSKGKKSGWSDMVSIMVP